MAFTDCAPVPLYTTELGVLVVTFKIPAVIVKVFAIPNIDDDASCKEVPFIVTLNK